MDGVVRLSFPFSSSIFVSAAPTPTLTSSTRWQSSSVLAYDTADDVHELNHDAHAYLVRCRSC